ncbi:MAG: SPFH domain-containing protein [Thermoanaerobaculia bacterium]|nr:SPFH domain-containing protein [Thermoanaerobaculia bacterium]
MGLLSKLRNEVVDIVEWIDHTRDTLVWRFPRYRNEIKQGAQLIVRPGQVAVFVTRGQLADVFEPGTHTLETGNLPILSSLQGWRHGFESPFKSEVYFVSTRQITELKWGTPNPLPLRDPEFGLIRLRAYGTFALRAYDPKALLRELVGTDDSFEADEIHELMRGLINTSLAEVLGNSGLAALDMAANYQVLADRLRLSVAEKVDDEYGLDVPSLYLVNISFPEEVEKALDARTSMNVIGDLGQYQRYQMGQSMPIAAGSGGGAGDVLGIGMGLAMAGGMQGSLQQGGAAPQQLPAAGAVPPPLPAAQPTFHVAAGGGSQGPYSLQQVVQALSAGQITPQTLVWSAGMSGWTPAGQVPQLAGSMAPPPLPGAPAPAETPSAASPADDET